jgi:hypothetical protein
MKSKLTLEKLQNLNTMTAKQQKQFEKLLSDELMKPENQELINEIVAKIKNHQKFKD